MHKYKGYWQKKETPVIPLDWWKAERLSRAKSRVVLKLNASNGIRIGWAMGYGGSRTGGAFGAEQAGSEVRKDLLVSKLKPQSMTTDSEVCPKKRRSMSLSKKGGEAVQQACAVMQRAYKRKVAFITLTLPGGTPEAMQALADNSRQILNNYMQRVRDYLRRNCHATQFSLSSSSLPTGEILQTGDAIAGDEHIRQSYSYVGVWEPQKRGALHLHIALGVRGADEYRALKKLHKKWWIQTLATYSNKLGVDLFARAEGGTWADTPEVTRTECNRVKKDVGRYMTKYISKGKSGYGGLDFVAPHRWWFMSKALHEQVQAEKREFSRVVHSPAVAEEIFRRVAGEGAKLTDKQLSYANFYTGKQCGFVMYLPDENKHAVFERLCSLLEEETSRTFEQFKFDENEDLSFVHQGLWVNGRLNFNPAYATTGGISDEHEPSPPSPC